MATATANKNAPRRVSIISGQKPVLLKSQSANVPSAVRKVVAPVPEKEKPAVSVRSESASVPMAVTQPSEVAAVRKEKEQLEQQLAAVKARALESEDKAAQLSSHVMVLEDLLEQKKGQLDFIEGKLEAMGMDPIAVRPFDKDASLDRQAYLKQQAAEFDDRLLFLRQGVERRNELLSESLRALQHISEALEVLETQ